ncbi:hypothetical protein CEXT_136281 [Caerostris extrusa]|uniref:Secreted protein n=1 Tax=Caerostris extrusa TaxID=172846 RepID=A0AAV4VI90_CAEEX|nr:hypothetical protein CEXT_136281 [Caerostris extrusa]
MFDVRSLRAWLCVVGKASATSPVTSNRLANCRIDGFASLSQLLADCVPYRCPGNGLVKFLLLWLVLFARGIITSREKRNVDSKISGTVCVPSEAS